MRFQRSNNQVFLYDPEGLLLDKISPQWLNLVTTPVILCHSWFVFSKYKKNPEYQRTGCICIELAKSMFEGAKLSYTEIQIPPKAHWPLIAHCKLNNIVSISGIDTSALNCLLVQYPELVSSNSPDDRAAAIEHIVEQQTITAEAEREIVDLVFADTAYQIPPNELLLGFDTAIEMHIPRHPSTLIQQVGSQFFFAASAKKPLATGELEGVDDLSALKNFLAYYQSQRLIVISDNAIDVITSNTTPEIQKRLHTQCLGLLLQQDASQLQYDLTEILASMGYREPAQAI